MADRSQKADLRECEKKSLLFELQPLRLHFIASESIHFAEGTSPNLLRGAFGKILRRIACKPECTSAAACKWRECPYARLFEPRKTGNGPSGFADRPRPFVFRAIHLDECAFEAGSSFSFDLHLFDGRTSSLSYLVRAFAELACEGLGPHRRKVELNRVALLSELGESRAIVYANSSFCLPPENTPMMSLDLAEDCGPVSKVRVKFVAPMELKSEGRVMPRPEFRVLAARIRDRISLLRESYGVGALPIDFEDFGRRAADVAMTRCDLQPVIRLRRSSRTGQVHSIGGFVGEAEYTGRLGEFVPYLRAARWTGVGRQTVWGKGVLQVEILG